MKAFREYWTFSAIRGAMTLLASIAVIALPYAASSMLSIPVLIALVIDCWATYCIMDSAVIVLLAKLLPAEAKSRKALYLQAAMGVVTSGLLYLVGYGVVTMRWVLAIAVLQAGTAALVEWRVSRDTYRIYKSGSCFTTAIVLAASAVGLAFTIGDAVGGTALALATFIGLYGGSELFVGAEMLFAEYRAQHPAPAWLSQSLLAAKEPDLVGANCGDCSQCPADAACRDFSLKGQMAQVVAGRQPAIVRTVRLATLLESHAGLQKAS
jgi:hypothetical protein